MNPRQPTYLDPEFASLLLNSMALGVFTVDISERITSWNQAMERITGYTAAEAVGQTCRMLNFNRCFGKRCPSGVTECKIFETGGVDDKECFLRHKDGHDVLVAKTARLVLDAGGKVRGVVETITDLSELHKARLRADNAIRRLGEMHRLDRIIGKSKPMQQLFLAIQSAAASESSVLIQGESGTGKELVAGAVHFNSDRSEMPFVAVNCSALSETLLESELFGHVKGAFTGASRDRIGRFEEADGGTLFLDEIGEISATLQIKLLRVLQEREIERVGESKKRKIDIRIITATNKHLFSLVRNGTFREDLYYRLKVFPIHVPPLRHRKEDIPLLISHFIQARNAGNGRSITGVTPAAERLMLDYAWPGNVRELENAIEHAFVLCRDPYIDVSDLPIEIRQMDAGPGQPAADSCSPPRQGRAKLSRHRLIDILTASGWNKAEAGRQLGLSRAAIWKYMKKWDIPMSAEVLDTGESGE